MTEREPRTNSIASHESGWNYTDRFTIDAAEGSYETVDQVAVDWFAKQPSWLRIISTNTLSRAGVTRVIERDHFSVGSAVGSWRIVRRNDNEIVFGDSMGFMEYWFSFLLPPDEPNTVEVSTAVRYLWPRSGQFYFRLVKPLHRRFVKIALVAIFSAA
ncbi:MAG: DUF2867 domain-containing protein [Rhodoglobus sp.]